MINFTLGILMGILVCILWRNISPYVIYILEILGVAYRYYINNHYF